MLDPLSALSVASAVVQLVDFGCKLVSQTQEIYHSASGATRNNVTSTEIANDIKLLYRDLTRKDDDFYRQSEDDRELGKLIDRCNLEAENLLALLKDLEVAEGATQWTSFKKAIKVARRRGKVESIQTGMRRIQQQVDSRLQLMMNNQQSALSSRMNEISKEHTRMQLDSVHHMDQLKVEIRKLASRKDNDSKRAQTLVSKLEDLAREAHQVANEEKILKSLEFDEWKRRFTEVYKAHKRTFDWISEDSNDPAKPHTLFKKWLLCQNGIYWIGGKPGSGKSTLMKFIVDNPNVHQCLQDWAGPLAKPLIITWFFWAAGSPMQRSKEGLFQSLLFQILRRCTELIPIVCARRWQAETVYDETTEPWSLDELDDAFTTLAKQPMPGIRFCIFVDGLDEYEGLPSDVIDRLQLLANSASIKICVSSRPLTEFREAFAVGKCDGSLLLQQHTKPDIERFVRDMLEKNATFTEAEQRDKRYGSFINEVIERAKGVFLWVHLVVNDTLKGLGEKNKLEDLQDKLNAMPGV